MSRWQLWQWALVASVLLFTCRVKAQRSARVPRDVLDIDIVQTAHIALSELSKLSESNIYTTLSLMSIVSAFSQPDGVYHANTYLTLRLACPYFNSGNDTEEYDVVVMRNHLELDKVSAVTWSAFPLLREEAIERYWIAMVEAKRATRAAMFRDWSMGKSDPPYRRQDLESLTLRELRTIKHLPTTSSDTRVLIQSILDDRWTTLERMEASPRRDEL